MSNTHPHQRWRRARSTRRQGSASPWRRSLPGWWPRRRPPTPCQSRRRRSPTSTAMAAPTSPTSVPARTSGRSVRAATVRRPDGCGATRATGLSLRTTTATAAPTPPSGVPRRACGGSSTAPLEPAAVSSGATPTTSRCPATTTATVAPISPSCGPATGSWWIINSSNGAVGRAMGREPGLAGPRRLRRRRPHRHRRLAARDREWFIIDSSTWTVRASCGAPGRLPVPGDYDGDGRTDIAVWRRLRPASGTSSTAPPGPLAANIGAIPRTSPFRATTTVTAARTSPSGVPPRACGGSSTAAPSPSGHTSWGNEETCPWPTPSSSSPNWPCSR